MPIQLSFQESSDILLVASKEIDKEETTPNA